MTVVLQDDEGTPGLAVEFGDRSAAGSRACNIEYELMVADVTRLGCLTDKSGQRG